MGEVINTLEQSFDKTKKLFFPIRKEYWLRMGLINLFGGGARHSFSGNNLSLPENPDFNIVDFISQYGTLIGVLFFFFFFVSLFFTYVGSVFTFMFIEGIVNKNIKIRKSFKQNHNQGLNLFFVRVILGIVSLIILLLIFSPILISLFKSQLQTFNYWLLIPMFLSLFIFIVLISVFWFLAYDFVVPIMYLKNYKFLTAWDYFIKEALNKKTEIFLYWIVKIGVSILVTIASIILIIPLIILLIIIAIPFALLGVGIYFLFTLVNNVVAIAITSLYGFILLLLGIYILSVVFVPVSVFFRMWSIEMTKKVVKI